jgi:phosphatidate cytidylyltransferase
MCLRRKRPQRRNKTINKTMSEFLTRSWVGALFVLTVLGATFSGEWWHVGLWSLVFVLGCAELIRVNANLSALIGGVGLLLVPAFSMVAIGWGGSAVLGEGFDPWHVAAVLLMLWVNDTAAYLVGSSIGKHKLMPSVSPRKSWEGLVGGMVSSAAVAWFVLDWDPVLKVGWGALFGAVATAGDLTESAWKRRHGLKDSGNLMPGHGGVLDRMDGLLYTAPAHLLLLLALNQ